MMVFAETLSNNLNERNKKRAKLAILQINLGNLCNQTCKHCHVDASPEGKKIMQRKTINEILQFLSKNKGLTLDITGGAPELKRARLLQDFFLSLPKISVNVKYRIDGLTSSNNQPVGSAFRIDLQLPIRCHSEHYTFSNLCV